MAAGRRGTSSNDGRMRVGHARGLRVGDREQLARGGRGGRRHRAGAWVVGECILPAEAGSRILKRVFYRLAFTALSCHQRSREYYLRKRAEGKGGEQAVIAPARRRAKMVWAMLRDGRPYEDREPVVARWEDRDAPS